MVMSLSVTVYPSQIVNFIHCADVGVFS